MLNSNQLLMAHSLKNVVRLLPSCSLSLQT